MRFEIELKACYRPGFSNTTQFGKIVNISAVGILFTVQNDIPLFHLVRSNQEWALDFACDTLATGRGIGVLAVVDAFTRETIP